MSRTITPRYALDVDGLSCATWNSKQNGKPTAANLEKWVMAYAKSLEIGGCNEHISKSLGHIPYPRRAVVRENKPGGAVVAEWKAGMFQVYA